MRQLQLHLVFVILALLVGCGASSDGSATDVHSTNGGIEVSLASDGHPKLMETVTLTCRYQVDYPLLPEGRMDYVVSGQFALPSTHFMVVSGESSWVDTVMANSHREHRVVARAIKRGDWLVDAFARSVIQEDVSVISGSATVEIHVK